MSIRVIIVDDHKIFVEGLRASLREQYELAVDVVAEVRDGREAIRAVEQHCPDIVIMDVSMPGMNGIAATRRISTSHPNVKVLFLSMHQDRRFVLEALRAGAAGYVLKESALEELITAIRRIAAGDTYLSPGIAGMVVEALRFQRRDDQDAILEVLTKRECEVLQMLAEGHSTQEVADRLAVSAKTISTHREHIMNKLGIHSIAGLTKYAIRRGLTSLEH